jgi:hypothetical protein
MISAGWGSGGRRKIDGGCEALVGSSLREGVIGGVGWGVGLTTTMTTRGK